MARDFEGGVFDAVRDVLARLPYAAAAAIMHGKIAQIRHELIDVNGDSDGFAVFVVPLHVADKIEAAIGEPETTTEIKQDY